MKAILIDVENKTVTDVEYDGTKTLQEWYRLLKCDIVVVATDIPTKYNDKINSVMVDEEGLLSVNDNSMWFIFKEAHQPFVGNGLIVGLDDNSGETIDVIDITADDVRDKVIFAGTSAVNKLVKSHIF